MEIYHREHLIIIGHMTTCNDLAKWNVENTIIDWINHMGSGEDRQACVSSAFAPLVVVYILYQWSMMDHFVKIDHKIVKGQYFGRWSIIGPYLDNLGN